MGDSGNALGNSLSNTVGEKAPAWADYCSTYSYAVLYAALAFLAAGLIFVAVAAYLEARKAKAEAERVEAEARKAAAEAAKAEAEAGLARAAAEAAGQGDIEAVPIVVPVNAVTTFIKSFATVLGEAKAWVAMVLIGLLLLWMAGAAPGVCGKDIRFGDTNQAGEADEDDGSAEGNGAAGDNSSDDATDNGSGATTGNGGGNAVGNEAEESG